MNQFLFIVIGALIIYIIGTNNGIRRTRIFPRWGGNRGEETGSGSFLIPLLIIALILHFTIDPSSRLTQLPQRIQETIDELWQGDASVIAPPPTERESLDPVPEQPDPLPPDDEPEPLPEPPDAPPAEPASAEEFYLWRTNLFSSQELAEAEYERIAAEHPALIVSDHLGRFHVGYGPFDSEAAARDTREEFGWNGLVQRYESIP